MPVHVTKTLLEWHARNALVITTLDQTVLRVCVCMFSIYIYVYTVLTLKCLSIGTPNIINFPFVSNGKLMIFSCPNIQTDYNEAVLCLNFGTPESNEFSIWDKWKIYYF